MSGLLIAFEGLDQSGKQTQAERLRDRLTAAGRRVQLLSFPDYDTPIGQEIGRALRGERADGGVLVCDRYLASSIAYGEAHGLDAAWLTDVQRHLPQPDITFLLDIAPEVSARRKTEGRDRFERDLELLARVRNSYLRQARDGGWIRLDADRDRARVAEDVWSTVSARALALPQRGT